MGDAKRDHIVLRDKERSVEIFGELIIDGEGCRVEGIAAGLTFANHHAFKPTELEGTSTERGDVWLERTYVSPTVFGEALRPNTVKIRAFTAYWGDFDPRTTLIERAGLSLDKLEDLSDEPLTESSFCQEDATYVSRTKVRTAPVVLLTNDEFTLSIEYLVSIGIGVSHEQVLSVVFNTPTSHARAARLIDIVAALISVLTDCSFSTSQKSFVADSRMAFQWKAGGAPERIRSPGDWLQPRGKIVAALRQMLQPWIDSVEDERALLQITSFQGAAAPSVYLESGFLSYCQCFEDLNKRRRPLLPMDAEEFNTTVVSPLKEAIAALPAGVDKDLRGRLLWSVKHANDISLRERLQKSFDHEPFWRARVCESVKNLYERIEKRRNRLSHGDPEGAILNQADADELHLEKAFIYLHCLSEIIFLGGLAEKEVNGLVKLSEAASHVQWLASKVRRAGMLVNPNGKPRSDA